MKADMGTEADKSTLPYSESSHPEHATTDSELSWHLSNNSSLLLEISGNETLVRSELRDGAHAESHFPKPPTPRYIQRLPILVREGIVRYVRVNEIDWIQASSQYLRCHRNEETLLARAPGLTLSQLSVRLDPRSFIRIHRSHIVNINSVEAIDSTRRSRRAILRSGQSVPISSSNYLQLEFVLDGNEWS